MEMNQGDIISAFPRANAYPNTYCFVPKELSGLTYDMYKEVKKALYGLPEAANLFNKWLNNKLINLNYIRSKLDPCIYYKSTKEFFVLLSTHVDNIGIFFKKLNENISIDIIVKELLNNLPFTDEGNLYNYLNVNIDYDNTKGIMKTHQHDYINSVLNKYNIKKQKHTPILPIYQLNKEDKPIVLTKSFTDMPKHIQEKVGSLRYIVDNTRPDMLFATARASTDATGKYVERIFEYLNYSKHHYLIFRRSKHGLFLHGYVDASFLQNPFLKSYYGYSLFLNRNSGSFYCVSKTITSTVPQSITECEYYAIVECAKTLLFFYYILKEINIININTIPTIVIYTDSQSSIDLANSPEYHPKSRHFNPKYHMIRDLLEKDLIELIFVTSENNCSDTHTKALTQSPFSHHLIKLLGLENVSE
jgi:hypothetical protein